MGVAKYTHIYNIIIMTFQVFLYFNGRYDA